MRAPFLGACSSSARTCTIATTSILNTKSFMATATRHSRSPFLVIKEKCQQLAVTRVIPTKFWVWRDETKFFDARNRVETELSYAEPLAPLIVGAQNSAYCSSLAL